MSNVSPLSATKMANQAKDRLQNAWSTLKSLTMEEDGDGGSIFRLKSGSMEPVAGWESMMKTMFGSCTTGMPHAEESPSNSSRSSKSRSHCEPCDPASPVREKEEFFYAQFLSKNESVQSRAEKAVSSVRNHRKESPPVRTRSAPKSKPFPVSTPPRKQATPPVLVHNIAPSYRAPELPPNGSMSFDDGISAISAHTLEELARQEEAFRTTRGRSELTTDSLDEDSLLAASFSPARFGGARGVRSPKDLEVTRSHSGLDMSRTSSRLSKRSAGTKSTRSSSEFENAWRKDEQKYWQDVVEHDETNMGRPESPEKRQEIMLKRVAALKERSLVGTVSTLCIVVRSFMLREIVV